MVVRSKTWFFFLCYVFCTAAAQGQSALSLDDDPKNLQGKDIRPQDVIEWQSSGGEVTASGEALVTLHLATKMGFTIYQEKLNISAPLEWSLGSLQGPPTERLQDPVLGKEVDVYTGGDFKLSLKAQGASPEQVPLEITFVGCTQVICLFPYTQTLNVPLRPVAQLSQSLAQAPSTQEMGAPAAAQSSTSVQTTSSKTIEEQLSALVSGGKAGFFLMLLVAFLGGLATNLTPCVAPMIPITLRVLSRQGTRPWLSSLAYGLGILLTYTVLGLVAAWSGQLFGSLLANKGVSLVFALLMMFFGATMVGFGNWTFLQQLGGKIGTGPATPFNALLMGCGAGLVAAPCTGPILATLLTTAAKDARPAEASVLLCIYSLGFALPYVFLGSVASRVTAIRVSPLLQGFVKVLFASIMFGLGFYYLRLTFYKYFQASEHLWLPLATAALVVGFMGALLSVLVPSFRQQKITSLAASAVLGLGMFFAVQVAQSSQKDSGSAMVEVKWYWDLDEAYKLAATTGKPILLDAWAEWCEACKKMDVTTFADPKVRTELAAHWITAKIDLTESNPTTEALQEKYELQSLPTLTLIPPSGDLKEKMQISGYVSGEGLLEKLRESPWSKLQ